MIVDLPLPPNKGNMRDEHWAIVRRKRQKYWDLCSMLLKLGRLPQPPKMPPYKTVISCHIIVGGKMDEDNLMARLKWPIDWLRGNDYIRGDSMEHLVWADRPTQEVKRKVPYRAIFTLEPAEV